MRACCCLFALLVLGEICGCSQAPPAKEEMKAKPSATEAAVDQPRISEVSPEFLPPETAPGVAPKFTAAPGGGYEILLPGDIRKGEGGEFQRKFWTVLSAQHEGNEYGLSEVELDKSATLALAQEAARTFSNGKPTTRTVKYAGLDAVEMINSDGVFGSHEYYIPVDKRILRVTFFGSSGDRKAREYFSSFRKVGQKNAPDAMKDIQANVNK